MEDLDMKIKRSLPSKYIFFGSCILFVGISFLVIGYLFKNKIEVNQKLTVESENLIEPSDHLEEINNPLRAENNLSKISESELSVVTSELGFSMKYPHKNIKVLFNEEELFKAIFMVDPAAIETNEEILKKLGSDIHNLHFWGLIVTAFEIKSNSEFGNWVEKYIVELKKDRDEESVLGEEIKEDEFLNLKAYRILFSIQGPDHQGSPLYLRKEIFVKKDQFIYHFSYLTPAPDTSFTRSGEAGKKYLKYVETVSEEIIKTFKFDNSSARSNILPKNKFNLNENKKEEFNNILINLRKDPSFDTSKKYPDISNKEKCVFKDDILQINKYNSEQELQSPPGVYFSVNEESAEIHAYDEKNNHTGKMSGFDESGFVEEGAEGFDSIYLGSRGYGISLKKNLKGRIEIVGKAFGYTGFGIAGDGNDCIILDISMPTTPYSICKLPITDKGDFGPFSCDIDGDGSEDYLYSLIYPPLEQKKKEIESIMGIMMENK